MEYHHPDASPEDIAEFEARIKLVEDTKTKLKAHLTELVDMYVDTSESDADGADQCDTWDFILSIWYIVHDKYPCTLDMTAEERWLSTENIWF
jgi:hypothetical protein